MAGVAVVAGVAALPTTAFAQDYTSGVFTGDVVDGSGKPVVGATVTIVSNQTGISRSTTTTSTGTFSFSSLPIGDYDVMVEASGYSSESAKQIVIEASKQTNYEFTLASSTAGSSDVIVRGARRKLAFSTATTGVVLDVEKLTRDVPVGRNLTSLVLMAPGTVKGDAAFGNLASVGGSSVAENAYYLNGMNITDFNNYLGSSSVPFEFFKSVEVKEGGQPAEFGRATGGIVNAVTKSGTNEFKGAVRLNWTPNGMFSDAPNTIGSANQFDKSQSADIVVELGGPIWKDHLYAYGLVQRVEGSDWNGDFAGGMREDINNNNFYGLKLDGYINPDHHLELTYFDTSRDIVSNYYAYDSGSAFVCSPGLVTQGQCTNDQVNDEIYHVGTGALGALGNVDNQHFGAPSYVLKYTGKLTDWLTISAASGVNQDVSESDGGTLKLIQDANAGNAFNLFGLGNTFGNAQRTSISDGIQTTERKFTRADADILFSFWGDHHVRLGWEKEENSLVHFATRTGPGNSLGNPYSLIYRRCGTSVRCKAPGTGGGLGLGANSLYVELNYYNSGGEFHSENIGYYIQDEWKVNKNLTLSLGLRSDDFNNFTGDGSQFINMDGNLGPRLGFSYDPTGEGKQRIFGSYGVYYLPVAANTAFRQAGSEYYFREYWTYSGLNADKTPILGTQLTGWTGAGACPFPITSGSAAAGTSGCNVTGDGSIHDPTSAIDQNLSATKEEEFILGYEFRLGDYWNLGVTYLNRSLKTNAEDVAIDAAVNAYCAAEGITGCSSTWSGFSQYTIINPGKEATIVLYAPVDGETTLRTVTFSAQDLGYPAAKRSYDALEFSFKRAFDGVWSVNGSYTLSRSRGNSEGYVQSDFGQDDAGITQDFDQPGFVDYSSGLLPNDRTHKFKLWGYYQFNEKFSMGTQIQVSSPRSLSCFGYHPTDPYANAYGAASHYCNDGEPAPRGKGNKTDWIKQVDISARYRIDTPVGQTTLRADIFNLFNGHGVQKRSEIGELSAAGDYNYNYGHTTQYQTPRFVRLGADWEF